VNEDAQIAQIEPRRLECQKRTAGGRPRAAPQASRGRRRRLAHERAGSCVACRRLGGGFRRPEKTEVKIGFIPLTDCASVVIASVMKFDEKYGIKIVPSKEASWAAVRDKLVNGELDAAHVLYGLIYGVQMGIGGPKKDMAVLMNLNTTARRSRSPTS
jgi:nitrate/nitrite transport system substrate-binding protein